MSTTRADPGGDGADLRGTAGRMAREIGDEARSEGRRLRDEASEGVRRRAEGTRDAAGAYLNTLASAVGSGAEAFRRDGLDGTGALLDRAAEEIGEVADRMAQRTPEELLRDVQGFARRHPAVFFGSAFLLAFGAARLLKSSPPAIGQASRAVLPADSAPGPTAVGMPPGSSAGAPVPASATPGSTPPSPPRPNPAKSSPAQSSSAKSSTVASGAEPPGAATPSTSTTATDKPAKPSPGAASPAVGAPAVGAPAASGPSEPTNRGEIL